jgi:hypothetical protein
MKTILHAFDITAERAAVFDALTTLDGLAGWWTTSVGGAAGQGGVIDFTFGGDFNPLMRVGDVGDGGVSWRCVGGHQPWSDNLFRFELGPDVPVSVMFRQEYAIELSDLAYATYNFNWGYYLDSLRLYLETGAGKPFKAA